MIDQMDEVNPFAGGDSTDQSLYQNFIGRLREFATGQQQFTLILDDPLSNCFIYNPNAPEDDP